MKYTLYHNSPSGMHCVQACLQMLLSAFGKPVLTLTELDKITIHDPDKFTWLGQALIWLNNQDFEVVNYENLDYGSFAKRGRAYLRTIWDAETFDTQDRYSDLAYEQSVAKQLMKSTVELINSRLTLGKLKRIHAQRYFIMLSVNPFALHRQPGYGSHLVVIKNFGQKMVSILDPDAAHIRQVPYSRLSQAISPKRKPDFNAICVRLREQAPQGARSARSCAHAADSRHA